jgi:hypothetical protein
LEGYTEIISYSAFVAAYPPSNRPLPNHLHTCFHIEKESTEAGYAVNNANLPFLAMCDQCKRYKEAIELGNKWIKKQQLQWLCGAQYRCVRLKSWRTGMNLEEGLYNNASVLPQIDTTVPVIDSKQPPEPMCFPLETAISSVDSEQLLQLHIQQDNMHYQALKKLTAKNLVTIQQFNEQVNFLTLQNKQLTLDNESLKTSIEDHQDICDDLLATNTILEQEREDLQLTVDSSIAILSSQNDDFKILLDQYCQTVNDLLTVETNPNLLHYKTQV